MGLGRSAQGWERLLVAASAQRSMPHPGEHAQHRTSLTAHEHDAHLYSSSGQGICAGLSRWGTAPSRVPASIKELRQVVLQLKPEHERLD